MCLTLIKERLVWVGVIEWRCFVQNIIIYAKGKILANGVYGEKYQMYLRARVIKMLLRFLIYFNSVCSSRFSTNLIQLKIFGHRKDSNL